MKNAFNMDSPLFRILSILADIMILTLLWLIGCLPIFTIGSSTTALYSCMLKYRQGEEDHLWQKFWAAYKRNFGQATLLWLVEALLLATVAADLYLVFFTEFNPGTILKMLMLMVVFVILMISSYVFPLQAFFINPVGRTLKNAVLLSVMYLPVSLVVTFINLVPFLVWLIIPEFFTRSLFLWGVLGGGAVAYINSGMLLRIFQRHITKPEGEESSEEEE